MGSEESIQELVSTLDLYPANIKIRLELAEALLDAGRYVECSEHVRHLIAAGSANLRTLGLAAMSADMSGDTAAATAYEAMIRLSGRGPVEQAGVALTVPLINLCDVEGYSEAKRRLERTLIQPFRHRRDLTEPARVPAGMLLYGPSGSAKSHFAHALAGELHINLVKVNVKEAIDPWGAALPGAIRAAFEIANRNSPTMILLEDVETVAHRRLRYTPRGREALDELVEALDANDRTKVLVVATTSRPWQVNPALRTVGRFERSMLIGPPDFDARRAMLERHLTARVLPTEADVSELAARTEGCTTNDLAHLCSLAAEAALQESVDCGRISAIKQSHFLRSLDGLSRSAYGWFDIAYNSAEFTDDSDEYDPLFDYIRKNVRRSQ